MFLQEDKSYAEDVLVNIVKKIQMNPRNEAKIIIKEMLKDRTTYGDSPLHCALRYGQRDNVRRILMLLGTLGTDAEELVNIQNSSGKVRFLNVGIFYLITKILMYRIIF